MDNRILEWYTINPLTPNIIAFSENSHWERTNCYLVNGSKKSALIDTGTGIFPIKKLTQQHTDNEIFVITTHFHWDHIGNHDEFDEIYIHPQEEKWCTQNFPLPKNLMLNFLKKDVDPKYLRDNQNVSHYEVFNGKNIKLMEENHIFDLGDIQLQAIHTPGHSPGHVSLVEHKNRFIFTGDLIYRGNLYMNYESTDPQQFYASLQKISDLKLDYKFLPGHNIFPVSCQILPKLIQAMDSIGENGELKHGLGQFNFDDFSVFL